MSILNFGNVLNSLNAIVEWVKQVVNTVEGVFSDVNFSILYSWLPSDIAGVITSVIAILLFLALIGIVRRILFFIG